MAGDTKKKAQQKVKDSATGVEVAVPQPPKRRSAYQIFVQQQRDATKAANPAANSQEILGILAKAWNNTNGDERAKLEKDADEDPLFDLSILREPKFIAAVLGLIVAQVLVFGYILWDERRKAQTKKKKA